MKKTKTPAATAANTNPAILPIEAAASHYAIARRALARRVADFEAAVARLRSLHVGEITQLAADAKQHQDKLETLIKANRGLFEERRTIVFHGIKLGLQKGKGKVEWADKEKLVQRIFDLCSDDQQDLLLETTYTPRKDALATLDAALLKKLGVTVTGTGDQVVIKGADAEVEKIVARILAETSKPATDEKEAA